MPTQKAQPVQKSVRETAASKETYTAVSAFSYGGIRISGTAQIIPGSSWGEHAAGDTVTVPDGWELDQGQTEHIHMQDKKEAAKLKKEFQPRRTVFVFAIPRYEADQRGRLTDKIIGYDYRRVVLPIA